MSIRPVAVVARSSLAATRPYCAHFARRHISANLRRQSRPQPPLRSACSLRRHHLLHSSLSLTYLAFGIGFSVIGYFAWNVYTDPQTDSQDLQEPSEALSFDEDAGMPAQVKQGWPGNLTPEQEQKLKQFWLKLDSLTSASSDRMSIDSVGSPASSPESKKKKRFSMFRKRDGDDAEDDDKHGQMKEFRQALKDLTPEQLRSTIWSMVKLDDPDALMLRFLRARKWDVQKAVVMLISTIHWRSQDFHLDDDIVPKGELFFAEAAKNGSGAQKKLGEDFMSQLRTGKSFVHGLDKDGRPLCFVRVKLHRAGEQSEEALEKFTVWTIETTRMMLRPPVDTAVIVFDMTDFGMANMDYTPVKFMIKVFEANYPESLGAVCVYRAPWIFSSIWNVIKGWLDPVVASKVHFAKDATELSQFVPIENIPKSLGGKENWEWKYLEPQPGENELIKDTASKEKILARRDKLVDQYEAATRKWVASGPDAAEAAQRRSQVGKQLQENYWELDPYVRAKTVYDRFGVLQEGGVYVPYPERQNGTSITSASKAEPPSTPATPAKTASLASTATAAKSEAPATPAKSEAAATPTRSEAPETPAQSKPNGASVAPVAAVAATATTAATAAVAAVAPASAPTPTPAEKKSETPSATNGTATAPVTSTPAPKPVPEAQTPAYVAPTANGSANGAPPPSNPTAKELPSHPKAAETSASTSTPAAAVPIDGGSKDSTPRASLDYRNVRPSSYVRDDNESVYFDALE